jgi:Family of unknown function (DUF6325)
MAIGPVQMLVVGFEGPEFKGEILEELTRLKDADTIRLIDLVVVKKDDDGTIETLHTSDLTGDEALEFGAVAGALIGLGAAGEEGAEGGAMPVPKRWPTARSSTTTTCGTPRTRSRTEPQPVWR